jgi:Zn-dependent protease with chaperone function
MDFFGAQARARRDSRLLGWAYAGCVAAVVLVIGALALSVLRVAFTAGRHGDPFEDSLWTWAMHHPGTVVLVLLLLGAFIGGASLLRMMQLREGGGYVARSLGGVRVERNAVDPRRRMLSNVVEEMAIASGVPMPEVYVLEKEDGINAFAAGHTPADAAVAVTRGALQRLNREQLQAVIAHEFSHILNGDMRLSIRLIGLNFGLMAVAAVGRTMLREAAHARRAGAWLAVLGAVMAVVGYIGWVMARLLQAWISRRRESLADASAVQFTRNPEALKQALVRVAAMGEYRRYATSGMEQVAHMLFTHGARSLFATHPPLLERLQALDPSINKDRLESLKRQAVKAWQADEAREATPASAANPREAMPLAGGTGAGVPAAVAVPAAAALIAATAGDPAPRHIDHAMALRRALPPVLRASAEDPKTAQAVLLSIVIYADHAVRERRLDFINERLGPGITARVREVAPVSANLAPLQRLPAVLQLMPALRALPPPDRLVFTQVLRELVRLDGGLTVFEYALEKLVVRALLALEDPRPPHGRLTLEECTHELGVVFSVLARSGAHDAQQARQSYEAGMASLLPRHRPGYGTIDDWVAPFDEALDRLCQLQAPAKQLLVEALVRTIAHDALLAPSEAELLRAICAVLECPLPPILPPATEAERGAARTATA